MEKYLWISLGADDHPPGIVDRQTLLLAVSGLANRLTSA